MKKIDIVDDEIEKYTQSFKGCVLPDFSAIDIHGNPIDSKKLHGRNLFINFWFTRCGPCLNEFESLNRLKDKYGKDILFLSFVSDKKEKVDSFINRHPLNFIIIPNSDSLSRNLFKVSAYPTNMMIDKSWRVATMETKGQTKTDSTLKNFYVFSRLIDSVFGNK